MKKTILLVTLLLLAGFSAKAENVIYAVFQQSIGILYYDDLMEIRGGVTSWNNTELKQQVTMFALTESMKNARPTSTRKWFDGFENVTNIRHLEYLNTSEVIDMYQMFGSCSAITTLDLRSFDITNVTDMQAMFSGCTNLTTIYCKGNWSATSANTQNMFNGCTSLVGGNNTNYDPNHTDASYARLDEPGQQGYFTDKGPEIYALYDDVTKTMTLHYNNMCVENDGSTEWFEDLRRADITTVILSESMQEARPTNTAFWFRSYINLTEIQHLDYLNTSEVTSMRYMFHYCQRLTSVDLRSFDVTNVLDMYGLFEECSSLTTILCGGNWVATTANTENMFKGCTSIVGGNGTTYNPNHTNASYAHLDKPGFPGYFSLNPTGLEEINAADIVNRQSSNRKFMIDGQLYILRDGHIFNVQGARVK